MNVKKYVALLLCVLMCVNMLPMSALADEVLPDEIWEETALTEIDNEDAAEVEIIESEADPLDEEKIGVILVDEQPLVKGDPDGETVYLQVVAHAENTEAELAYQWQVLKETIVNENGETEEVWEDIEDAVNDTYIVEDVPAAAGQTYRCCIQGEELETVVTETVTIEWEQSEGLLLNDEGAAVTITKQPVDAAVQEGKTAAFTIAVSGTGITYQWQYSKDGGKTWVSSTAAAAKTAAYKTTASAATNGRLFRCVITDGNGKVTTSEIVSLTVLGPLAITKQPVDAVVQEGKTAAFTIAVSGTGVTYQWQYSKDGGETWVSSTAAAAKTATYKTTASATTNGRLFRCVIGDSEGRSLISEVVSLTVEGLLSITKQPEDVTILVGKTAAFTIEANGNGITYQWQYSKDGGETWVSSTAAAAKTAAYKTSASAGTNGRLFRCIITDGTGKTLTSDVVSLTVEGLLSITKQPEDVTILVGKTAAFTVEADGNGITYQWQYSKDGGETWVSSTAAAAKTAAYKTSASAGTNGRLFRCIITDGTGKTLTSDVVSLTVEGLLSITKQPEDVTILAGKTAAFTIEADGNGITYQWQYSKDGGNLWVNSTAAAAKTATYKTSASTGTNGRLFRCVITDSTGKTVISESVSLTVIEAFAITGQPESLTLKDGAVATFTVEASGTGITYQWQYSKDGGETWVSSTAAAAKTAAYKTSASAGTNGRLFRCILTDITGAELVTDTVSLSLIGKPEILVQPEDVKALSGKVAAFRVEAAGDSITYQWQYSKDGGELWINSTAAAAKTAAYKTTASASTDGRLFRCVITDSNGQITISEIAKLTVLEALAVTKQPTAASAADGETAEFSVTATGTGVTYQWQYKAADGDEWNDVSSDTVGYNEATLQVSVSTEYNGYSYRCVLTDITGTTVTTDAAELKVSVFTVDEVIYEIIDDASLRVIGYTGSASSVVIPENVNGRIVTEIGDRAFESNTALCSIDLPDTITIIGERAFADCTSLMSMN